MWIPTQFVNYDHIFCIRQILEKCGNTVRQCISSLQTSRKLIIQLGEALYKTVIEFGIPQETGKANKIVCDWNVQHSPGG